MCSLPLYVIRLDNAFRSRMCATDKISPNATTVRNVDNWSCKHLRSYMEVEIYLLMRLATELAIAELYFAIFR